MSYKSARKRNNSLNKKIAIALLVLAIIVFRKPIFSLFGNGASVVVSPVWGAHNFISGEITESLLSIQKKETLIRKLLELQDDFMAMSSIKTERDLLAEENEDLKKIVGLYRKYDFENTSRVLSRPPVVSYDTIMIDSGERDGVLVGDRVFTEGNIYLGKIKDVNNNSSLVELVSTSGVETSVRLVSSDISLTLVGRGGGAFLVNVPRDISIDKGGIFVPTFDSQFIVAEVSRVTGDAQDPTKTVIAKTPLNLNYINYVFIKR